MTDAEPALLSPGRHHRDEEPRIDVGKDVRLVVRFATDGTKDSTVFKDGDEVVVVGQVPESGTGKILHV